MSLSHLMENLYSKKFGYARGKVKIFWIIDMRQNRTCLLQWLVGGLFTLRSGSTIDYARFLTQTERASGDGEQKGLGMEMPDDAWLRRHAVMIASQLPEDPDVAEKVLRLTLELLEAFIRPRNRLEMAQDRALRLVGCSGPSRSSASSRDSLAGSPNHSQSVVSPGTA
jgi:hypothetical protein